MATAKLSGSLLGYRDVPNDVPVAPAIAKSREGAKSALYPADSSDNTVSDQVIAPAGRPGSVSFADAGNRRPIPILRVSFAICGIAATTAVGIALFMQVAGRVPATAPQANPASPTVSNSPLGARALEPSAAVTGAGASASSERVVSATQPATIGASASAEEASQQPPAAVAALISPQPEPVNLGYAAAPTEQARGVHLSAQEVAALLARGDGLFGNGDIASARLCYERAAEAGDAQAALRLGQTYDPAFLARAHLNGVRGDGTAAARWYRRAFELGAVDAQILLTGVATNDDAAKRPKEVDQLFEQFLARRGGQTR